MKKFLLVLIILSIIGIIFYSLFVKDYILGYRMHKAFEEAISNSNGLERDLLVFMKEKFLDRRGLIGSEINKGKLSDYCLLETMGQLMEYSLLVKNKRLFDITWRISKRYFLSSRGYLYWRINRRTLVRDDATSLIDSLRMANSLIMAYKIFKEDKYLEDGKYVVENIIKFNSKNGYLVDFFDGRTNRSSDIISLFYLNLDMILNISESVPNFKTFYETSKKILKEAIKSIYPFFPNSYNIFRKTYFLPPKINMIEQVCIAINIKDYDLIRSFIYFVDKEYRENDKIYTYYYPDITKASEDESAGVYALLAQLFLTLKIKGKADVFYKNLNKFLCKDGGFGDCNNRSFYAFDQLEILKLLVLRNKLFGSIQGF